MKPTDPEFRLIREIDGSLRGALVVANEKHHGFIDSAEGIRAPFDRKKATARAKRMRARLTK